MYGMDEQLTWVSLYLDGDGEPVHGRVHRGRKSVCPRCGQDARLWGGWDSETGWIPDHAAPDFSECGEVFGVFADQVHAEASNRPRALAHR